MKKVVTLITLVALVIVSLTTTVFAAPSDVRGHWAENYITTLLNQSVMGVYNDGQFKPNQAITRGEFAEALAKALYLGQAQTTELTDINNHPARGHIAALVNEGIVTGFPDKTFRPNERLTRAQVVTMLTRALGLEESKNQIKLPNIVSFQDMNANHWANTHVMFATELDILNGYPDGTFRPNDMTSRAEAAKMIGIFRTYTTHAGFVADVYPSANKIAITGLTGQRTVLGLSPNALVGRNNRIVPMTDFLKTDNVFVITDANNNARYIKGYGLVTKADLVEEVSSMTSYILQPFEVEAIARGDFNILKPKMMNEVQAYLLGTGLNVQEVNALLNTDWNALEEMGKVRLSEAIAMETGLPLDMVRAIMAQDWDRVKTLAQVEAIQRMVQGMWNSGLFS